MQQMESHPQESGSDGKAGVVPLVPVKTPSPVALVDRAADGRMGSRGLR